MAADPDFVRARIRDSGRFLFHLCRDEHARREILRDGLIPADERGAGRYDGCLTPRPGHVYLCAPQAMEAIWCQADCAGTGLLDAPWVAVDLTQLNPARINPDEDCFFDSFIADDPVIADALEDPLETVRDDISIRDTHTREFHARPYGSYGEWAQAQNLGSIPAHTHAAWLQVGSLAHHGRIGPEALGVWTPQAIAA